MRATSCRSGDCTQGCRRSLPRLSFLVRRITAPMPAHTTPALRPNQSLQLGKCAAPTCRSHGRCSRVSHLCMNTCQPNGAARPHHRIGLGHNRYKSEPIAWSNGLLPVLECAHGASGPSDIRPAVINITYRCSPTWDPWLLQVRDRQARLSHREAHSPTNHNRLHLHRPVSPNWPLRASRGHHQQR